MAAGGSLTRKAGGGLLLLVVGAYAVKTAYEWLVPIAPGLMTAALVILGLVGLVAFLARRLQR